MILKAIFFLRWTAVLNIYPPSLLFLSCTCHPIISVLRLWFPSLPFSSSSFFPQVFCAGMQTETPQEYITLTTGEEENFSEIFGFR